MSKRLKHRESLAGFGIGEQLIRLRNLRGLTQEALAKQIGAGIASIGRVENGDVVTAAMLRRIADALDGQIYVVIEPKEKIPKEFQRDEP